MYHSIIFINSSGIRRDTWDNWQLIPTKKPTVSMPDFANNFIDVPGRNGSIDMTDYLTGGPTFSDRSGSWEFYVVGTDSGDWDERMNTIAQFIHGKSMKFILEDDPNYYYEGRISLSEKNTEGYFPKISISYRVKPFKTHVSSGAQAF